jgi:cytochrome bd-type quinol oxidase subunit 2
MSFAIDLATVWAFILAFAVFVYVVMDGFDLGLGILFPLFPAKADRDVIMNSVAPVWDGNETWLVLGGVGVMAAFPLAYSVLLPALYAPIIAMLIALVFRGVAFEFRWRVQGERNPWDLAFAGGSWLAALAQGIALGDAWTRNGGTRVRRSRAHRRAFSSGIPQRPGPCPLLAQSGHPRCTAHVCFRGKPDMARCSAMSACDPKRLHTSVLSDRL